MAIQTISVSTDLKLLIIQFSHKKFAKLAGMNSFYFF